MQRVAKGLLLAAATALAMASTTACTSHVASAPTGQTVHEMVTVQADADAVITNTEETSTSSPTSGQEGVNAAKIRANAEAAAAKKAAAKAKAKQTTGTPQDCVAILTLPVRYICKDIPKGQVKLIDKTPQADSPSCLPPAKPGDSAEPLICTQPQDNGIAAR